MKNNYNSLQSMESAMNKIGKSIYTNEFAARLIAYSYLTGREETVTNEVLHNAIMICKDKMGLNSGINSEMYLLYSTAIQELKRGIERLQIPEWVNEIESRYKLKPFWRKLRSKK